MAIRLVFHWGPKTTLDMLQQPYITSFRLYPNFAQQEKIRYATSKVAPPATAILHGLSRSKDCYVLLEEISRVSRARLTNATYQSPHVFIPESISVIHVVSQSGDRLPWQRMNGTKVWRLTAPKYLDGLPYNIVLHKSHTDETPTPIEEMRKLHFTKKYRLRKEGVLPK